MLYLIYGTYPGNGLEMLFTILMTLPFLYDACVGINVLRTVFSKNIEQREADLIEEVNKVMPKQYNNRLPEVLKTGDVA